MDTYILIAPVVTILAILGPVLWLWHSDRKENRKNFAILNEELSNLDESTEKGLSILASHDERLTNLDETTEKGLNILASHDERLTNLQESSKENLTALGGVKNSISHVKGFQTGGESVPDKTLPDNTNDSESTHFNTLFEMPSIWVDREQFLIRQFEFYDYEIIIDVLRDGPPQAGISLDEIDMLADDCIAAYVREVHRISSGIVSPHDEAIDRQVREDINRKK